MLSTSGKVAEGAAQGRHTIPHPPSSTLDPMVNQRYLLSSLFCVFICDFILKITNFEVTANSCSWAQSFSRCAFAACLPSGPEPAAPPAQTATPIHGRLDPSHGVYHFTVVDGSLFFYFYFLQHPEIHSKNSINTF